MLEIVTLPVLVDNYIYLIHDTESLETVVVDPALAQPVLDFLQKKGWKLNAIFNTHHHSDHVGGNLEIKRLTGCKILASQSDWSRIPGIDHGVNEGDTITVGRHVANVIATPGHTLGHVVYHFVDDNLLFCGDTLFVMGCGRLFEGTSEQMWHSLQKLKMLSEDTKIYCTHEYTQNNGRFALTVEPGNEALQQKMIEVNRMRCENRPTIPTTIKAELATNPFFREGSPEIQQLLELPSGDPLSVFSKLRQMKDAF